VAEGRGVFFLWENTPRLPRLGGGSTPLKRGDLNAILFSLGQKLRFNSLCYHFVNSLNALGMIC